MEAEESILVSFVIPWAPFNRVRDWDKAMEKCNKNLHSIISQTNERFEVLIVYNEDDQYKLPSFTKCTPFRLIPVNFKSEKWNDDKQFKTLIGVKNFQGKYMLRIDWDDLVHRDLVQYVEDNENEYGFVINKGYYFNWNNYKILELDNFSKTCGSCHLINYTEEERQKGPLHKELHDLSPFHHMYIEGYRKTFKRPLSPINERFIMYNIHDDNISHDKHLQTLKDVKWKEMKSNVRQQFSL